MVSTRRTAQLAEPEPEPILTLRKKPIRKATAKAKAPVEQPKPAREKKTEDKTEKPVRGRTRRQAEPVKTVEKKPAVAKAAVPSKKAAEQPKKAAVLAKEAAEPAKKTAEPAKKPAEPARKATAPPTSRAKPLTTRKVTVKADTVDKVPKIEPTKRGKAVQPLSPKKVSQVSRATRATKSTAAKGQPAKRAKKRTESDENAPLTPVKDDEKVDIPITVTQRASKRKPRAAVEEKVESESDDELNGPKTPMRKAPSRAVSTRQLSAVHMVDQPVEDMLRSGKAVQTAGSVGWDGKSEGGEPDVEVEEPNAVEVEPVDFVESIETDEVVEPVESVESIEAVETVKTVGLTKTSEAIETAESVEDLAPADTVNVIDPDETEVVLENSDTEAFPDQEPCQTFQVDFLAAASGPSPEIQPPVTHPTTETIIWEHIRQDETIPLNLNAATHMDLDSPQIENLPSPADETVHFSEFIDTAALEDSMSSLKLPPYTQPTSRRSLPATGTKTPSKKVVPAIPRTVHPQTRLQCTKQDEPDAPIVVAQPQPAPSTPKVPLPLVKHAATVAVPSKFTTPTAARRHNRHNSLRKAALLHTTQPTTQGDPPTPQEDPLTPHPTLPLRALTILVSVYTLDGSNASDAYVTLLHRLGARTVKTLTERTTHVVFKDGPPSLLSKIKNAGREVYCVNARWVLECEERGVRVDEGGYRVEVESQSIVGKKRRRKSMEPRGRKVARSNGEGRGDGARGGERDASLAASPYAMQRNATPITGQGGLMGAPHHGTERDELQAKENIEPETPKYLARPQDLVQCTLPVGRFAVRGDCDDEKVRRLTFGVEK